MKIRILGSRGIPAHHGGFETFAEQLSLYLVAQGHKVVVYCQTGDRSEVGEDTWCGVERVTLYGGPGAVGTVRFDWDSVRHAAARDGLILTLGYNTAVFSLVYVLRGRPTLMNMDGLEWKRPKWSKLQRLWLRLNEFAGAKLSTHLIADHPEIGAHLRKLAPAAKISIIHYGADAVTSADETLLQRWNCTPDEYAVCIARPEPENSHLEIVRAFSARPRGYPLLVLGTFNPANPYHRKVQACASPEVVFPGPIYDRAEVNALRFFARFYVHGHRVGGTNPSLVESLAAGNAVIARHNNFNGWVAGEGALYFATEQDLERIFTDLGDNPHQVHAMRSASVSRHDELFTLDQVHRSYEDLLLRFAETSAPEAPLTETP